MSNAIRRKQKFTQIANKCLNDKRISLKAKGLMALLMSNAEEWDFYLNEIVTRSTDGLDGTRSGLVELENFGYLKRYRVKDDKGKYTGKNLWLFDDEADIENNIENSDNIDLSSKMGKSYIGKTYIGKSTTNNNKRNNTNLKKEKLSSKRESKIKKESKINQTDFLLFVSKLKEGLKPKDNDYPTLVVDGIRYGINNKNLLYNKETGLQLDAGSAIAVFRRCYDQKIKKE